MLWSGRFCFSTCTDLKLPEQQLVLYKRQKQSKLQMRGLEWSNTGPTPRRSGFLPHVKPKVNFFERSLIHNLCPLTKNPWGTCWEWECVAGGAFCWYRENALLRDLWFRWRKKIQFLHPWTTHDVSWVLQMLLMAKHYSFGFNHPWMTLAVFVLCSYTSVFSSAEWNKSES